MERSHSAKAPASASPSASRRSRPVKTSVRAAVRGRPAADAALPVATTMAIVSRCANLAFSQQVEQAYAAVAKARELAIAAAAIVVRDCPPGAARDALLAALARQEATSDRMMDALLQFARAHGHLAFAFPFAAESAPGPAPRTRSRRAQRPARRAHARPRAVGDAPRR